MRARALYRRYGRAERTPWPGREGLRHLHAAARRFGVHMEM